MRCSVTFTSTSSLCPTGKCKVKELLTILVNNYVFHRECSFGTNLAILRVRSIDRIPELEYME